MRMSRLGLVALLLLSPALPSRGTPKKLRIFVVSSYHREYLWSQETTAGLCRALRDFGYLDGQAQEAEFIKNDFVETSRAVIQKAWMDSKRKSRWTEMARASARIVDEIGRFKPDALMLGDDNANNLIGAQFLDTSLPIFTWGMDVTPLKYGLIESLDRPGHNVTGTYQAFPFAESLALLKRIVPSAKTFAVLSDDSETGRAKMKKLRQLGDAGRLPLRLVDSVATNSYAEWRARALQLSRRVDAFFIVNHNTIRGDDGELVDQLQIGAWYLRHIKKPECAPEEQFVVEGMLCAAVDSGFKQGYAAVKSLDEVFRGGLDPAALPCRAPSRGPLLVNRERARMLGLTLTEEMGIERSVDSSLALQRIPEADD